MCRENVVIKRSKRRKYSVGAVWEAGVLVVTIPEFFSVEEEKFWVKKIVASAKAKKDNTYLDDTALFMRSKMLSQKFLDNRVVPSSVIWVSNQKKRWGSATPSRGTIRISDQLKGAPNWVIDYVLLHELAHFIEPNHGDKFWKLLDIYPESAKARGFLEGYSYGMNSMISDTNMA